jgi:hypothetical protein
MKPSNSATSEARAVVGVFEDRSAADAAYDALHRAGFQHEQLGFAASHEYWTEGFYSVGKHQLRTREHAAAGGLAGSMAGGLAGAVAAGLIPGVGPVIAGGLLAGILVGAAAGGSAGIVLGGLTALGMADEDAHALERDVQEGRAILTVRAPGRGDEASEILHRHGAVRVTPTS